MDQFAKISQIKEFQSLGADLKSWCLGHPVYCSQLAVAFASVGVPSPVTLILIMRNKKAIQSLLQSLVKNSRHKKSFQSFFMNRLGLNASDLQTVNQFQKALDKKISLVCQNQGKSQSCRQARSHLQELAKFLQPLLKN